MSKAFTSDSDEDDLALDAPALPAGTRNYMTPAGAEAMRAEVERLNAERRRLPATVEGKSRGTVIERRLRYLLPRVEAIEVLDPLSQPKDKVLFGATVTVSRDGEKPETWRIVGIDEMDLDKNWISWMSPLAAALLDKRTGETIVFLNHRLTITRIEYSA